jgi:hypothetical protein
MTDAHSDAVSVKRLDIREIGAQRGLNSFNFNEMALWLKKLYNSSTYNGWVDHSPTWTTRLPNTLTFSEYMNDQKQWTLPLNNIYHYFANKIHAHLLRQLQKINQRA